MGDIVGSVVGGLFGLEGADRAADAQVDSARIAAEAFKPFNVNSGLGRFYRTAGGGFEAQMSDALSALRTQQFRDARQTQGQATAQTLGVLNQLAAPGEEETRTTTRERLFQQGRLGTAAGLREVRDVEQAIQNARLQRQLGAFDLGQQLKQQAFSNYITAESAIPTLLGPLSVNRNPGALAASQGLINAGNTRGAATLGFANSLTPAISSGVSSIFNSISGAFGGGGGGLSSAQSGAFGYSPGGVSLTGVGPTFNTGDYNFGI